MWRSAVLLLTSAHSPLPRHCPEYKFSACRLISGRAWLFLLGPVSPRCTTYRQKCKMFVLLPLTLAHAFTYIILAVKVWCLLQLRVDVVRKSKKKCCVCIIFNCVYVVCLKLLKLRMWCCLMAQSKTMFLVLLFHSFKDLSLVERFTQQLHSLHGRQVVVSCQCFRLPVALLSFSVAINLPFPLFHTRLWPSIHCLHFHS